MALGFWSSFNIDKCNGEASHMLVLIVPRSFDVFSIVFPEKSIHTQRSFVLISNFLLLTVNPKTLDRSHCLFLNHPVEFGLFSFFSNKSRIV